MKIHAIQTGTVAVKQRQRRGEGQGARRFLKTLVDTQWTEPLPIYVYVIEHPEGIIVIDTGETARTSEPGYFPRWHPYFRFGVREWVQPEEEIGVQLQQRGIDPDDVRWLVMTHLHTDHAGGLHHFPHTEIVVSRTEYENASGVMGRMRGFLPNRWPAWFAPRLVDCTAEKSAVQLGPFPRRHTLTEAGDVHLVPVPGHTAGQMAVILQTDEVDYFFAGDTSYTEELMVKQAVDGVAPDERAARLSLARTLHYVQMRPTVYLPSHDPEAGRRLEARQTVSVGAQEPHYALAS